MATLSSLLGFLTVLQSTPPIQHVPRLVDSTFTRRTTLCPNAARSGGLWSNDAERPVAGLMGTISSVDVQQFGTGFADFSAVRSYLTALLAQRPHTSYPTAPWAEGTPLVAWGVIGTVHLQDGTDARFEASGPHLCVQTRLGVGTWWRLVPIDVFPAPTPPAVPATLYIENLTWPEVRDAIAAGRTSAIIYTGSTEQNGPHMALGKHNFLAHYIAGRIAQVLGDALVYPTLPFAPTGDPIAKTGHMRFPGSVSISSEVFLSVVRETAQSAITAGFRRVYLMGDHGSGQDMLERAAQQLDSVWRARGVRVQYVRDLYYREKETMRAYLKAHGILEDRHAGTDDTSELMYLDTANQWIRRDKLAASDSTEEPWTGVSGDPSQASPELGRMFIEAKINAAVEQIRRLRASP